MLNRNEVMRARKAQQAVHWARKRASPWKLRNPDEDRIVLIEDTSEIHLEKPNLVRFEARQAQPDLPAITTRDLLKASLRHRLDRIILGEIRGGEAFDLLQYPPAIPGDKSRHTNKRRRSPLRGLEPVSGQFPSPKGLRRLPRLIGY